LRCRPTSRWCRRGRNGARSCSGKGAAGFDQPGDSILLMDRKPQKIKITAKKGSTLYFICGLHPWMQGTIKVR
jgi:hypothetical protein